MSNLIDARTPPPPIPGAADRLSPDAAPSEAQLVRRVAQGDREAFGELYDCCSTPLYSLAVCMLNDPRAAAEVLQEVFLSIWENAPLFDEVAGSHFSWAVTMTRNKSMDCIRDWQRKFYEFEVLANCALVAGTTNATHPGGGVLDDRVAQLRATLNELPPDQRRLIEIAFFGGITHFEIADALEEPVETIQARIGSGMLGLRAGLEGRI